MTTTTNPAMHLPDQTHEMTLCGRTWHTFLLSQGQSYPICPDCWEVQASGGVALPDPVKLAALPPREAPERRRVEAPIKAIAERLDR